MRPLLLSLALVFAALITWLAWPREAARVEEEPLVPTATTAALSERSGHLQDARGDAAVGEKADATSPTARALVNDDAAASQDELADAQWIEGRVVFPSDTPSDERATIIAVGREFASKRMHSAPVAADGSFRVAFHPKARLGRLRLDARYCYVVDEQQLVLAKVEGPVEVTATLGGRARVRIEPSAAARPHLQALIGAEVVARGDGGGREKELIGPDATVEFGGLPGTRWWLSIDAPGFERVESHEITVEPGRIVDRELPLRRGARVDGRVVDEAGTGLAEVRLWSKPGSEFGFTPAEATSSADGTFAIEGVALGKFKVSAQREGYLQARSEELESIDGVQLSAGQLVMRRGRSVIGNVSWPDGTPGAGVKITISRSWEARFAGAADDEEGEGAGEREVESMGMFGGTVVADAKGDFALHGMSAQKCIVRATSSPREVPGAKNSRGKPLKLAWSAEERDVVPNSGLVKLVLSAGSSISGTVVDDAGAPVAMCTIVAQHQEPGTFSLPKATLMRDARGRFELSGLTPGIWQVNATHTLEGGASERQKIQVPYDGGELTFVLPRPAQLSGVVLATDGSPHPRATVKIRMLESEALFGMPNERDLACDGKGRFSVSKLPPGDAVLTATADDSAISQPLELTIAPAQTIANVTLQLRVGATLTGLLLDREGVARADQSVELNLLAGGQPGARDQNRRATTERDGKFRFENLPEGDYLLKADPGDEETKSLAAATGEDEWRARSQGAVKLKVAVPSAGTIDVVLGGVPQAAVVISGVVTAGKKPLAQAVVRAELAQSEESPGVRFGRTDDEGRYSLSVDSPGAYVLGVSKSGGFELRETVEVPAGTFAWNPVLPGGSLAGRVVDGDGKPLPNARLSIELLEGGAQTLQVANRNKTADDQGQFTFDLLAAGRYRITADVENPWEFPRTQTSRWTRGTLDVELAADRAVEGLELRMSVPGTIEGVVRGPDGAPLALARITGVDGTGKRLGEWPPVRSDSEGRFTLRRVAPGVARLRAASANAVTRGDVEVTVASSRAAQVTMSLDPACQLRARTLDADGKPIDAHVEVLDAAGNPAPRVDDGDMFSSDTRNGLGMYAHGRYTVRATLGSQQTSEAVTVSGTQTVEVTLRMPR